MSTGLASRRELAQVMRIGHPRTDCSGELLMAEVRRYLAMAHEYERDRQIELADICGSIAAKKLQRIVVRFP